jgi:hypothetical protein
MLVIEIQDAVLEKELDDLLRQQFHGDTKQMMTQLFEAYLVQRRRLQYSGILRWPTDGLNYQRDLRNEWN